MIASLIRTIMENYTPFNNLTNVQLELLSVLVQSNMIDRSHIFDIYNNLA